RTARARPSVRTAPALSEPFGGHQRLAGPDALPLRGSGADRFMGAAKPSDVSKTGSSCCRPEQRACERREGSHSPHGLVRSFAGAQDDMLKLKLKSTESVASVSPHPTCPPLNSGGVLSSGDV